jgi:hypothetical protein
VPALLLPANPERSSQLALSHSKPENQRQLAPLQRDSCLASRGLQDSSSRHHPSLPLLLPLSLVILTFGVVGFSGILNRSVPSSAQGLTPQRPITPTLTAMPTTTCPACNHTFEPANGESESTPDPSVRHWFTTDNSSSGPISTTEAYTAYLHSIDGPPVSRTRFVADLAYLGIEEVDDDGEAMLLRD